MNIACLLNQKSGSTLQRDKVTSAFQVAHISVEYLDMTQDLESLSQQLRMSKATAVVAAGGDGTVNLGAQLSLAARLPLGVLPLGTLNHFAKDAHIPLALKEAIDVIAAQNVVPVDYVTVNQTVYVNNASLGLYPRLVLERGQSNSKLQKYWAMATAFVRIFRVHRGIPLEIIADGKTYFVTTPILFVGNNAYQPTHLGTGHRERLDTGKLYLVAVPARHVRALLGVIFHISFGWKAQNQILEFSESKLITIRSSQRDYVELAYDGEVKRFELPLTFEMHHRELQVLSSPPTSN